MESHTISTGELVVFVIFLLTPPMLVSLVGQGWYMQRRGVFAAGMKRGLVFLVATFVACMATTAILVLSNPMSVNRLLMVRDIWIGNVYFPIWPPAFVMFPFLAAISARLAARPYK